MIERALGKQAPERLWRPGQPLQSRAGDGRLTGIKACVSRSRWVSIPGFVMGMDEPCVLET